MCPQLCYVTAAVGLTLTTSYLVSNVSSSVIKSTPYLLASRRRRQRRRRRQHANAWQASESREPRAIFSDFLQMLTDLRDGRGRS